MPDLSFQVEGAEVTPFAMVPLLTFRLRVTNAAPQETIHNVVLRCQIQIESTRRKYQPEEEARLRDLFGEPERWGQTLRAMLWTHASVVVPPFTGETVTDLPVACSYDFNVAATKYFYALSEGEVPLDFLFSGSVFYQDGEGALQVAPISWSQEARFRLPIKTWQGLMEAYYPNTAWLQLRRDVFDRLVPVQDAARDSHLGAGGGADPPAGGRGGPRMSGTPVEQIASTLLYEGYLLYPYRRSAVKNRQRFNFGVVYPEAYTLAGHDTDPSAMQTECLVQGSPATRLDLTVRFLHLFERAPARPGEPAWHDAIERNVKIGDVELGELLAVPVTMGFAYPASDQPGRQMALDGRLDLAVEAAPEGVFRLRIGIANVTQIDVEGESGRDDIMLRSLVSAHTILRAAGGEFISLIDPPEPLKPLAAACRNIGTWPVLAGEDGARDTLLSSPIIVSDFPSIAPESPGDFFDGTEMDEMLSLRILTLTDEEKREMAASDERARRLLERTETFGSEQLMRMHGTLRQIRALEEAP